MCSLGCAPSLCFTSWPISASKQQRWGPTSVAPTVSTARGRSAARSPKVRRSDSSVSRESDKRKHKRNGFKRGHQAEAGGVGSATNGDDSSWFTNGHATDGHGSDLKYLHTLPERNGAQFEAAFTPETLSSSPAATQLLGEVDRLVTRHRSELNACFDNWLRQLEEPQRLWHTTSSTEEDVVQKPHYPTEIFTPPDTHQRTEVYTPPEAPCSLRRSATLDQEISRYKKKKKRLNKPFQELLPSRVNSALQAQTVLQRFFSSRAYESCSALLIFSNAIFMGCQTQYCALRAMDDGANNEPIKEDIPVAFVAMQFTFTFLFSAELVLRWACDGFLEFFCDGDMWWNLLDVWVVFLSIMDLVFEYLVVLKTAAVQNISVLRVMRVVRVVRVARVIRIMKFFRELRMMIYSILGSMKSLLWVYVVLGMTFYVFGITFTAATTSELDTPDKWHMAETQGLRDYFGTIDRSVVSLFMSMSGGNDWGQYYEALDALTYPYRFLYLLFISFAVFAVVNIVTGVFVETALQSNTMDRQIIVHEELEAKKAYLKSLREVFEEMDEDGSGSITLQEFESKLNDEKVIAYFNALKLDVSDARTLFWLLDYDHSDEVNIDEFLSGCYKLQGESRTLDMKLMQCEVRSLRDGFDIIEAILTDVQSTLKMPYEHPENPRPCEHPKDL